MMRWLAKSCAAAVQSQERWARLRSLDPELEGALVARLWPSPVAAEARDVALQCIVSGRCSSEHRQRFDELLGCRTNRMRAAQAWLNWPEIRAHILEGLNQ